MTCIATFYRGRRYRVHSYILSQPTYTFLYFSFLLYISYLHLPLLLLSSIHILPTPSSTHPLFYNILPTPNSTPSFFYTYTTYPFLYIHLLSSIHIQPTPSSTPPLFYKYPTYPFLYSIFLLYTSYLPFPLHLLSSIHILPSPFLYTSILV